MKRIFGVALFFSLPVLLGAQSSSGCTPNDFSGVYAALGEGTVVMVPPVLTTDVSGPLVRVGRVVAQDGNITFTYTVGAYHGVVYDHTFAGTYQVKPDCTLDLLFAPGPVPLYPLPLPFTGVLADSGNTARVSSVTPATVATATLTKVTGCPAAEIHGTYLLDLSGFVVAWQLPWPADAPGRNGVFARVGKLVLDGNGGFQGTAMANYAGLLEFEAITGGTYTVDDECKIMLKATVTEAVPTADQLLYPNLPGVIAAPQYALTLQGVMTDPTTAFLIQTEPAGVAFNGRLKMSVTKPPTNGPACSTFTATPSAVSAGEPVTLTWSCQNVSQVTIENAGGGYPTSGQTKVYPMVDTTYTLKGYGAPDAQPATATASVKVTSPFSGVIKGYPGPTR